MPSWETSPEFQSAGITFPMLAVGNLVVAPTMESLNRGPQQAYDPNVVMIKSIYNSTRMATAVDQRNREYNVSVDILEPILLNKIDSQNFYYQMNRNALSSMGSMHSSGTGMHSSSTGSVPSSRQTTVASNSSDYFQPNDRVQNLFESKNGTVLGKTGDNMFNVQYDDGSQANENQSVLMKL